MKKSMRFLLVLGIGVLLAGCSSKPGPACPHTGTDTSVQDRTATPVCDCSGPASTDQLCTPGPADSHLLDVAVEVTTVDHQPAPLDVPDAITLTDAESDCCSAPDPCHLSHNGTCDCGGNYTWDDWDCFLAPADTYLVDGYAVGETDGGSCCSIWDPCDWANDGICDCGGEYDWDDDDCNGVVIITVDAWLDGETYSECCTSSDPCDWADDGYCDCGGVFEWDKHDCTGSGEEDIYFIMDIYSADAEGCCTESDPCDWADDDYCDCDGEFEWDKHDCTDPGG